MGIASTLWVQAARIRNSRRGRSAVAWALFVLSIIPAGGAAEGTAGQPGEIYQFGAGGRALGMGGAYTAIVRDATSIYYNPAGLGLLPGREVAFMRAQLYGSATYDYLSYAQNKKRSAGGWGLELIRLNIGGAKGADENNNSTGDFGYSEMALGFAHGWRGVLYPKMSVGFKGKLLRRSLGGSSDSLYGADFGLQFGPVAGERLTLGAVVQNAFSFKQGDTEDSLDPVIRAGAAYQVVGPLSLAADVSDGGEFRLGTEYAFGILAVRFGLAQTGISFGGGLAFRGRYLMDLALANHPTLGMSQRLSLGYKFASTQRAPKTQFYAQEFLANAQGELAKRNYLKASKDLDTALGLEPRLGDGEWKGKAERLRRLVQSMDLERHPEDQQAFVEQAPNAFVAFSAVEAYLQREEDRSVLLAHAALGIDPKRGAYARLLEAVTSASGRKVEKDLLLPPSRLAASKTKKAMDAVYGRRFESAAELLKEALWLEPNDAVSWTRLGSAHFALGDRDRAKAAYQRAMEINPADEKLRKFVEEQGLNK